MADFTNFKMNDEGIKALFKEHLGSEETEQYYFCATSETFGKTLMLGAASLFTNKYFVFNVTQKGIHIYGLTSFLKPKEYSFIQRSEIKRVTMKNGFLGLKKNIEIEFNQGGGMKIAANKREYTIKEQGNNLEAVAKMF